MTLFRSLRSRLTRQVQLEQEISAGIDAAVAKFGEEFGEEAASAFARDLGNAEDADLQDKALKLLVTREPRLLELGVQVEAADAEVQPVLEELDRRALDRLELLRQTASSTPIPASEREALDYADAASAILHEDADGGLGRFAARRFETLPIENRAGWEAALRFEAEAAQQPREDPYAHLSTEELEALLPSDERGTSRTSSPGVLVVTEQVVDPDLERSVAQMRRELEQGR